MGFEPGILLNESFDMIMIDFAADAAAVVYIQTNLR